MTTNDPSCASCASNPAPYSREQAEEALRPLNGWQLSSDATQISRRYDFKNFRDAFAFVAKLSLLAEKQGHHPDIAFGWGYCTVSLQTHTIGGLHDNDFNMAGKINALN